MKKIALLIAALLTITLLSVGVFAEGEFETADGELISYSGTESVVSIPMDIKNIKVGAFDESAGITCIVFNSFSCTFETGAIPAGVTVKAPESSDAHLAALRDGLPFSALDGSVSLTIKYQFTSGTEAYPTFTEDVFTGDSYSYTVPAIDGFVPNIEKVEGVAGDSDITVTVIYRSTVGDGWVIKDGRAMYVSGGSYLVDTTEEINGIAYNFDENGHLIIASGFINTDTASYYFYNSVAVTGYRVIGKSIYYFNDDGSMVKGTTFDGHEFDIGGNIIANDSIVNIGADSYYLIANELYSGYRMVDGKILYFGTDYRMVKGSVLNGYTFDAEGAITSGISATDLEISGLSDVAYTGSAIEPEISVKFNGIMLTNGVHYKLYYSDNTTPGEAKLELRGLGPVSGSASYTFKIIGDEAYTLTIRYVNVMGAPIAESYTTLIEPGEEFDIPSPEVEGYKPDQESVSGTMGNSNITISVTYTKVAEESDSETSTDTGPVESTDVTTTVSEPEESEPAESEDPSDKESGYKYDYALLIKVFIIATLITGVIIVLILNWDVIKKALTKKNGKNK